MAGLRSMPKQSKLWLRRWSVPAVAAPASSLTAAIETARSS
jgi:hypothetical protein